MSEQWKPGIVHMAAPNTVVEREGYLYRGLGMVRLSGRKPRWSLTHLGSGHRVVQIEGDVRRAFPAATAFAELCEWDAFDRIDGWQQVCPDLPEKVAKLMDLYPNTARTGEGKGDREIAARVAYARA